MAPLIRYPVQQHAFVVADLDEAIPRWIETTGAGAFWAAATTAAGTTATGAGPLTTPCTTRSPAPAPPMCS